MTKTLTSAFVALTVVLAGATTAFAAGVGDPAPALSLKDQFDNPHALDGAVRRIYFNADRKGDGLLKSVAELDQSRLDAQKAIVVANISEAPGFVKRIIRSSLKDRRYTVWLDIAGVTKSSLPARPDQLTVLDLEQGRIKAVRYVGDADSLRKELDLP